MPNCHIISHQQINGSRSQVYLLKKVFLPNAYCFLMLKYTEDSVANNSLKVMICYENRNGHHLPGNAHCAAHKKS